MRLDRCQSADLPAHTRESILALCALAYDEDLSSYLGWIGPGTHLLAYEGDALVGHLLIVQRALQAPGHDALRTAYVELVATHPAFQRRGIASALLSACLDDCAPFELAALSPSAVSFYTRLGWEEWRGPLSVRTPTGEEPTPDEVIMVRRTAHSPAWLHFDLPLSVEWREGEVW
jgi:aminoglycoside 2'-N-acetyltransferase I